MDTAGKDFNADAPRRVEDGNTPIAFMFLIQDVWKNDLDQLHCIKLELVDKDDGNLSQVFLQEFKV